MDRVTGSYSLLISLVVTLFIACVPTQVPNNPPITLFTSRTPPSFCSSGQVFDGKRCVPWVRKWGACEALHSKVESQLCREFMEARLKHYLAFAALHRKARSTIAKKYNQLMKSPDEAAQFAKLAASLPKIVCKIRPPGTVICSKTSALLAAVTANAVEKYARDLAKIAKAYRVDDVDSVIKCSSGIWTSIGPVSGDRMSGDDIVEALYKCSQLDRLATFGGTAGFSRPALETNIGLSSQCALQDVSTSSAILEDLIVTAEEMLSACSKEATDTVRTNPQSTVMDESSQSATQEGPSDGAQVTSSETTTSTNEDGETVVTTKETYSDGTQVTAQTNTDTGTTTVDVSFSDGSSRSYAVDSDGQMRTSTVLDQQGNGYTDYYNDDGDPSSRVYTDGSESVFERQSDGTFRETIYLSPGGKVYWIVEDDWQSHAFDCDQLDEACATCSAAVAALETGIRSCSIEPTGETCTQYTNALGCCKGVKGPLIIPAPGGGFVCTVNDETIEREACKRQCSVAAAGDTDCEAQCNAKPRVPADFDLLARVCPYAISDACSGGTISVDVSGFVPTPSPTPVDERLGQDLWIRN